MKTKKTTKKPIKKAPAKAPVKAAKSAAPSTSQRIDGLEKLVATLKADILEYRTKQDTNAVVASTQISRLNAILESDNKRIKDLQNIVLYNEKEEEMEERLEAAEKRVKQSESLVISFGIVAAIGIILSIIFS
jgi:hypothetical protein